MLEDIIKERQKKLVKLKDKGINPYPAVVRRTALIGEVLKNFNRWQKSGKNLFLVGRLRAWRNQGKIIFGDLEDESGRLQLVFNEKQSKQFNLIKETFDSGDFVEASGKLFKTQRGEKSLAVNSARIISKSLRPLPTEWFGLKDIEERFRRRYLDLILNPEVKKVFLKRERIIDEIRKFLKEKNFVEVETPALQPLYGGAEARPFITNLNALKLKLYLSISPEIYLKKLIIGGFEKVFTICKNFRNEGIDKWHNPEFTMLELYESYSDYEDMMKLIENLILSLVKKLYGKTKIKYQGEIIDFKIPFKKIKMIDSLKKRGISIDKLSPQQINEIFEEKVQPKLIQPTFIIDYPLELCPLTKSHRENKKLVERFELFIEGIEIANAYSELNDPLEQEKRLIKQIEDRKKTKDYNAHFEANVIDEDFIESMSYGMPPLGGVGIGIDRLIMLLTNSSSIRDVVFFPFMRPK